MIQTILVPLDGSELAEQVLPYAVSFAQGLDARIWLLHVIDPESLPPLAEEHQVYLDQLQQNAEAHARAYLEHQANQLRRLGVASVMTSVQYGKPADVLAGYGEGVMAHDLIALSTHGRSGLSRLLLGSVADRVLHSTNTPLLVVRPREGQARARQT